jgi:hypothetical protein
MTGSVVKDSTRVRFTTVSATVPNARVKDGKTDNNAVSAAASDKSRKSTDRDKINQHVATSLDRAGCLIGFSRVSG